MSTKKQHKNSKANNNRYSANRFNNHSRQSFDRITKKKGKQTQPKQDNKPPVKISFLGGLNEIGKNITVVECQDDMILIDCGMAFPDGDMLGVDLVIPDFSYIEQNQERVRGIVLTHGHEDHIGGLPFLLSKVNVPLYGTPLTLGLVENKLREHSLVNKTKLNVVNAGSTIKLGCMEIKFIHVNHSIPDAVAFAIKTPGGTIVHTGDFKIDCTPISGDMIDLSSFARVGDEGVLALLAESTNAQRPGYTKTERMVSESLDNLFKKAENYRIIIATFASNVNRVQQIINCAEKYGRKVAFSGRSMVNYMDVAKRLGYLNVPENILIDIDMLGKFMPQQEVLVTTGSQGEPMSALSRMAYSDHRKVMVGEGDFIIISANPIPGNEKTVGNVVDELLKRGCKVIYESMYDVHVSGHACQEELKILHRLVKPKYFIPVHGEQKHLRKHLGQDGLIIIVASLDVYDGHVISGPDIVSRGFVYVRESEGLLDEVRTMALDILEDCAENNIHEWGIIKNLIKDDISKLISQRTRRSPMILPILQEV